MKGENVVSEEFNFVNAYKLVTTGGRTDLLLTFNNVEKWLCGDYDGVIVLGYLIIYNILYETSDSCSWC